MTAVQHCALLVSGTLMGWYLTTIVAWLRADGAVAHQVAELQRQRLESCSRARVSGRAAER
jgi:hypothetical protein